MKKIDSYVLFKFLKSVALGFLAFINIFILTELFNAIGYIIDGKFSIREGILYLVYAVPEAVINVFPMTVLLGSLMTVNKMASSLEIIALKTSGVSFKRIILFPVILSFIFSLGLTWFNSEVVPRSLKKKRELKYDKVFKVRDSRIKTDVILKGTGNYFYYIRLVNGGNNTVRNILILEMDNKFSKVKKVTVAQKGEYEEDKKVWLLKDILENNFETNKEVYYDKKYFNEIKESPQDFLRDKLRENELTSKELKKTSKFLEKTGSSPKKLIVAYHKKIAYPFACFVVSFLGLSLGSRYVRGASAVSIGLSVLLGYLYYVVQATMEAVSVGGYINPLLGAWVPNILFLTVGLITVNMAEY